VTAPAAAVDQVLTALADPTRRRTVDLLRRGPRPAGELARAQGLSPPAMSRHLRVLRLHGVVEEERGGADARIRMYRLRRAPFADLQAWLVELESFWSDQLGAFKAHVEARSGAGRRPARRRKP
jgi:DNA-binding transcriptional ArsR family regulator